MLFQKPGNAWKRAAFLKDGAVQSDWESSKGIAKAILHERGLRRKWLARWLMLTVGWMAVGLWVIDGWLGAEAWRFLAWWGGCGVLALLLMLFAIYDALAVIREEREKVGKTE